MQISRRFFPEILLDNEETYFAHLQGVIESIDELSKLEITRSSNGYYFRLVPSLPVYNKELLKQILKLHNMFNIHLNLSKSINSSATIMFEINLENK